MTTETTKPLSRKQRNRLRRIIQEACNKGAKYGREGPLLVKVKGREGVVCLWEPLYENALKLMDRP